MGIDMSIYVCSFRFSWNSFKNDNFLSTWNYRYYRKKPAAHEDFTYLTLFFFCLKPHVDWLACVASFSDHPFVNLSKSVFIDKQSPCLEEWMVLPVQTGRACRVPGPSSAAAPQVSPQSARTASSRMAPRQRRPALSWFGTHSLWPRAKALVSLPMEAN